MRGIILYASGSEYQRQADVCAESIYRHNKDISITTMVKDQDSRFATDGRCNIYEESIYDETIVLDTDTLVLENLDYVWDCLSQQDIYYPTSVFTFRGDVVKDNFYRKTFVKNKLPNVYNAFYYFKKSKAAEEFYKVQKEVNDNWEIVYPEFCNFLCPSKPSMDVNAAITTLITGTSFYKSHIPHLVHMKPRIQGWQNDPERWQDKVGVYVTDQCELFIGNYKQQGIFHYTENDFLTDSIVEKFSNA